MSESSLLTRQSAGDANGQKERGKWQMKTASVPPTLYAVSNRKRGAMLRQMKEHKTVID